MEGCSKYCSYCVVPYTRGEEISRPLDDVLREIEHLTQQGVKEITLLGQNVNAYRGFLDEENSDDADFALLIECIAQISGLERIRYVTSHPKEFTQRLIDTYAKVPQLVSHVYLPVQHASDRILMAMKRGYTALEYKSIIRRLRAVRPDIMISSDFIVGFPGETDADFEELMRLVESVDFDHSFSFVFSPRPGTPAANLQDDTPQDIKLKRLLRLQKTLEENTHKHSQAMLGATEQVLIEGVLSKTPDHLHGRTARNRVVHIHGGLQGTRLIGQIVDVKITAAQKYVLQGELVLS